jgi:hypothetical protein
VVSDTYELSESQTRTQAQIREIFENEPFHNVEHRSGWRWITPEENEDTLVPDWLIKFFDFLERNGGIFEAIGNFLQLSATLIEIVFWSFLAAIVIFIVYRYRDFIKQALSNLNSEKSPEAEKPTVLFGLDVTEESLPKNICDVALSAWQNGDMREALSLLLRASIVQLMQDHKCEFQDGFTEAECAAVVRQQLDTEFDTCFSLLVRQWQLIAYAHASNIELPFETLIQKWREVFKDA